MYLRREPALTALTALTTLQLSLHRADGTHTEARDDRGKVCSVSGVVGAVSASIQSNRRCIMSHLSSGLIQMSGTEGTAPAKNFTSNMFSNQLYCLVVM